MNIVEVYKTTDGKLFEIELAAKLHQLDLDRRSALFDWLELQVNHLEQHHGDIVDAMLGDINELRRILK